MRQVHKAIILVAVIILISIICIMGVRMNRMQNRIDCLFDDVQNQVADIKLNFDSVYKELGDCKNELAGIDYNDDILDIYNKINNLYETVKSFETTGLSDTSSNIKDEKEETTVIETEKEEPVVTENKKEETTVPDKETEEQYSNYHDGIYDDMQDRYYGRLYIPDLNINVALYRGHEPYITDRVDSANIFAFNRDPGFTIADHNYQQFSKLLSVKVGIKGYIQTESERIDIECVDVFNGYNTGRIVDENGVNAMNRADYMMYTCTSHDTYRNVLICLWTIV